MAQEKPVTPEKQLLSLIEKPNTKGSIKAATIKHRGLSLFSINGLKGRFSFFKGSVKSGFSAETFSWLDIKVINTLFEICIFFLAVYLALNFTSSFMQSKKPIAESKFKIAKDKRATDLLSPFLKELSYYLANTRERDIFKMGAKRVGAEGEPGKLVSSKILEATQNLRLVGISWSDDPDAMIEDTKALRTFFVKRGQMIGEIKVEAIFKDKVVLSYGKEELELK